MILKRALSFFFINLKNYLISIVQTSFEPGFGAYQSLAEKIEVPFSTMIFHAFSRNISGRLILHILVVLVLMRPF